MHFDTKEIKSDLHIHTIHSDGCLTVGEVLDIAKHKGLDCVSITDHDTVSGVSDAVLYGRQIGLSVIPGIEFSTFSIMPVHILGYGIDCNSPDLLQLTEGLLEQRQQRAMQILDKLSAYNINLDAEKLPKVNVGRSHIARLLKEAGYVSGIQEAFDRYLGEHRLAYVPSSRITPFRAVEAIKKSGGKAVIAHPLQLSVSKKLKPLIEGLKQYGLDGIEAYYPTHSPQQTEEFARLARQYGLFATGGSDFHYIARGSINGIGDTSCNLPRELRKYCSRQQ